MNYIVYEVKNKVNGKTYIGKHQTDDIYDDYLGSGKYLKRAINKYGNDCFEKVILYVFDNKKEMDDKEAELVNEEYVKSKDTYNLKIGGDGGFDYINTLPKMKEVRRKNIERGMEILREKLKDDDYRIKSCERSSVVLKRTHKEGKLKYDNFTGKHHTNETKEKIGKANSIHQQGEKNSQFGTCWIHNSTESIRIKKENLDVYIKQGWIKGRKMKF